MALSKEKKTGLKEVNVNQPFLNSKKVIFQVHRISKNNKDEVLEKAEKNLSAVKDHYIARLVNELQGTDFWKLRRAYSPGWLPTMPPLWMVRAACGAYGSGAWNYGEY